MNYSEQPNGMCTPQKNSTNEFIDLKSFMRVLDARDAKKLEQKGWPAMGEQGFDLTYVPSDNPIKNWLRYRCRYYLLSDQFDCDRCDAVKETYKELWPQAFAEGQTNKYTGDTMCSFWTTYKQALFLTTGKKFCRGDEQQLLKDFDEYAVNDDPDLKEFAYLTHTIGNLIIVPSGFNTGRYPATKDYWDITLEKFYKEKQHIDFASMVEGSVGDLHLEDWFDEGTIDGNVKMLFTNHSSAHLMPNTEDEIARCVRAMNDRIKKRGRKLTRILDNLNKN